MSLDSHLWRMFFGMFAGGILGSLVLWLFRTKSNKTYLVSWGMILRISLWLGVITLVSKFSFQPFNIYTTDAIYFAITAIVIFDSLMMQMLNLILGRFASLPISRQHPEISRFFSEGYVVYNDVPVISVVYPIFRWIFG
jgi:hypothetical protein